MPDLARWQQLWQALGAAQAPAGVFDELMARYAEPHRNYHSARHLDECFARLAEIRAEAVHPEEIECALWFHDAIYDSKRQDNEARSADWAKATAIAAGLPEAAADRIHALVMATRHDASPEAADQKVLVDVDLSILGETPERFDEYERQIREEYAWVPSVVYRSKRRKVLKGFLARPAIFSTAKFVAVYEPRARANLQRSIKRLGG